MVIQPEHSKDVWHEVLLDKTDYDTTNKMFIFDAGQGNIIDEFYLYGQVSSETGNSGNKTCHISMGNDTSNRYYTIGLFSYSPTNLTLAFDCYGKFINDMKAVGRTGSMLKLPFGYANYGRKDTSTDTLNVDIKMTSSCTPDKRPYWNNGDPRYIKIDGLFDSDLSYASIWIKYKLK